MGTRENLAIKHKILDAFDVAMFSYEVGLAKPDFRIYHAILEKLEASPQNTISWMILFENDEDCHSFGHAWDSLP